MSLPFVINRRFDLSLRRVLNVDTGLAQLEGVTNLEVYDNYVNLPATGTALYDLVFALHEMRRKAMVEQVVQRRRNATPHYVTVTCVFPTEQSNTVELSVIGDDLTSLAAEYNRPMKMLLTATVRNWRRPPLHLQTIRGEAFVTPEGRCVIQGEAPHIIWFNRNFKSYWRITATIELQLVPGDNVMFRNPVDNRMCMRRMYEQMVYCDFELVSHDFKRVQCHKAILASHSPVFNAMLETNFQEARDNSCRLDFSEEALKAFLKFCYYSDLEDPLASSLIALELLELGHQYAIPLLEDSMLDIFLGKSYIWYTVDAAVYTYIKTLQINTPIYIRLRKAVLVILRMLYNELEGSQQFIELEQHEPHLAMELMELL